VPIASAIRESEERRGDDIVADTILATVRYEGGISRYSDITVGEKLVQGEMLDIAGATSVGEFGSELLSIFLKESAAEFEFRGETKSLTEDDNVFGFRISTANNHFWMLRVGNVITRPGLEGQLWVSKGANKVSRLEILAPNIDKQSAADHVRIITSFSTVRIGNAGEFLLPQQSEAKLCLRNANCLHNVTEWTDCKRFAAKSRIVFLPN
jgi:hypothetical protein